MTGPRETMLRRMRFMMSRQFLEAGNAAIYEAADAVRAEAFRSISAGSVSGKNHVASAPGDAPNRDTGILQANIEISQPKPLVARVTSKAPYAAALERGTSKMAARPYMRPARDKMLPEAKRILKRKIKQVKRSFRNGN